MTVLLGTWRVRRRIVDRRTGGISLFEGMARIAADRFEESGMVRHAGGAFPASRRYHLRYDGQSVAILFADGRRFVVLTEESVQRVEHACGADLYRGRFRFANGDGWLEAWSVTGPRKDYRSLGSYRRAEDHAAA